MSTVPRWVTVAGAASVALVAAVAAYSHMYVLADRAGEGWRAWLEPLSVDGLLVGSSLILYVRRKSSWLTWASVSIGLLVSLAANLAAARPVDRPDFVGDLITCLMLLPGAASVDRAGRPLRTPAVDDVHTKSATSRYYTSKPSPMSRE